MNTGLQGEAVQRSTFDHLFFSAMTIPNFIAILVLAFIFWIWYQSTKESGNGKKDRKRNDDPENDDSDKKTTVQISKISNVETSNVCYAVSTSGR